MKKILFQGDSITDFARNRDPLCGYYAEQLGCGYPVLAAARWLCDEPDAEIRFMNGGISGNRIVDLYARWKSQTLNLNPDLISILIGVNDVWHEVGDRNGVEADRFEEIYRMLLRWTRKVLPEVKLLLMGAFVMPGALPEEYFPEVETRAAITKKLAGEFDAVYLPLQSLFDEACRRAPSTFWLPDGVHPSPAGHQLIADAWLPEAKALLQWEKKEFMQRND